MHSIFKLSPIVVVLLSFLLACNPSKQEGSDSPGLQMTADELFESYREFCMNNYPGWASYEGDHRNADKLEDNSETGILARNDSIKEFVALAKDILANGEHNSEEQLNLEMFISDLERDLAGMEFPWWYLPLTQQGGIHIGMPQVINYQKLESYDDYQDYMSRLKQFEIQVDNVIDLMGKGAEQGVVQPAFVMEQVVEQIRNILDKPAEEMVFMSVLETKSDFLSETEKEEISNALIDILKGSVRPAYEKLLSFINEKYLPVCRETAGVWDAPGGNTYYEYCVLYHTTLPLHPDTIFNTGMREVERIKTKMEELKGTMGFVGTLDEFFQDLRSNPIYYFDNKDSMMSGYRDILDEMDTKLPDLFGILPQAPYDLKEMEPYRARSAPQAYYYSAPEDRSRPGYFYVNTYRLDSRPKYTMTALALHEAVPGHHLQISIAQELEGLPWFRKNGSYTAFVEGWGLYAEYLGYETDMYRDPLQEFGALTFEMWRACRLVVDVGLHYKKWTREEAVQFMLANTPNSELDIRSEIDRYIVRPGQALAYKIGELKIKELRTLAEDELGEKFDVKAFHDEVLKHGAIPMTMLEENIKKWIAEMKAG